MAAHEAVRAEVRLFNPLFSAERPGADGGDVLDEINPHSKSVATAWLEPGLSGAAPEQHFQFERHGYFVADRYDHRAGAPVFNRVTGLKDGFKPA